MEKKENAVHQSILLKYLLIPDYLLRYHNNRFLPIDFLKHHKACILSYFHFLLVLQNFQNHPLLLISNNIPTYRHLLHHTYQQDQHHNKHHLLNVLRILLLMFFCPELLHRFPYLLNTQMDFLLHPYFLNSMLIKLYRLHRLSSVQSLLLYHFE